MAGPYPPVPQKAFFDEYVDLVPVGASGRRVTFLPQTEAVLGPGFLSRHVLLIGLVIVPTLLSAIYFFLLAADRYDSEARFAVRRSGGAGGGGMLSEILETSGPTRAMDEAYALEAYVLSRDAMADLQQSHGLDEAIAQAGADPWWALSGAASAEAKYRYYRRLVSISSDTTTGISTVHVEAFRPEDAQRLASALLDGAERMINQLNDRAAADALAAAEAQAAELKSRLEAAQNALVGFRTREEVVDPGRLSLTVIQTIALLTVQVAETEASLAELERTTPRSPQIEVLRRRIAAIEKQIAVERKKLGGGDEALAASLAEYESLMLEREFSQRAYSAALAAVEMTKSENRKQRVYVERVVQPQLSDEARYPLRVTWVLVVFFVSLAVFRGITLVIGRRRIMHG